MINTVCITGTLGRDVELRHTSTGSANCFISVYTDTGWNQKEQKMHHAYISASAFGKNAEYLGNAKKGDRVELTGHCDCYKDRNGHYVQSVMIENVSVIRAEKRQTVEPEPVDYSNILPGLNNGAESNRNDDFDMPF